MPGIESLAAATPDRVPCRPAAVRRLTPNARNHRRPCSRSRHRRGIRRPRPPPAMSRRHSARIPQRFGSRR